MKLSAGACSECGREGTYGKPSLRLCPICNEKRKAATKPRTNKRPRVRRVSTGEAKVFKEIWESRIHYCTNCQGYLPEPARTYYFSHIKPKGRYPELRLDPDNIELHCLTCHTARDQGTRLEYESRTKPEL